MGPFRNILLIVMTMGLVTTCSLAVWGQSPFDSAFYPAAFLIREHVEVYTDRSIYVVGEEIHFRADHLVEGIERENQWSSVLYVELTTSSGSSVSQGKFVLSEGLSTGTLHIPAGALTGNYYLKCYTRWMRNRGPRTFSYSPLKIVNPFNAEVTNFTNGAETGKKNSRREYRTGSMKCMTQKPVYGRGEMVHFRLAGPSTTRLQYMNCCITVVPEGGIDTIFGQATFPGGSGNSEDFFVNYLPDLYGASISGKVVRTDQKDFSLQDSELYFSLLGDQPDYLTAVTDANGRFIVSIPARTGIQELFVTPVPSIQSQVEIQIDQDFDVGRLSPLHETFILSAQERNVATRMAIHGQLSAAYYPKREIEVSPFDSTDSGTTPFYGTPIKSLVLDEYIKLPTLEEVFINLIPEVQVEVRRGIKSLKIFRPNSAVGLFQPLILIDNIPVFDHQAVLRIIPEKILRVDVINAVYVKGNIFHGGLISIISRKGDMTGIDLPDGSYFFDFQSMNSPKILNEPSFAPADRVPDTRNTVLWLDDVRLEKGSDQDFSFLAPSHPGKYVILVRGMAGQGEILSTTAWFMVE